jgi:hypothetical protein
MTILFADLSGFTALTEAHGDADGLAVADRFRDLAAGALCEGARLVLACAGGDEQVRRVGGRSRDGGLTHAGSGERIEEEDEHDGHRALQGIADERSNDGTDLIVNGAAL